MTIASVAARQQYENFRVRHPRLIPVRTSPATYPAHEWAGDVKAVQYAEGRGAPQWPAVVVPQPRRSA